MPARVLNPSSRVKKIDTQIRATTRADGNVFSDLGFEPDTAASLLIKAQLMAEISDWIRKEQLRQVDAAKILSVSRPRVSDIVTGKTARFSIDTLVDMLQRTGHMVEVRVS